MSDNSAAPPAQDEIEPTPEGDPQPSPSSSGRAQEDRADPSEVRVVDKRWWANQQGSDDAGESRSSKPSFVEDLQRTLADKDELLQSYVAKYTEAATEFEQTRVRLRREVVKEVDREKRRILATFLEVGDNLDRAIEAGQSTSAESALLQGVKLIRQQLLATLDAHGVTRIDAAGNTFDPTLHDAISTVPVTAEAQHNTVMHVVKIGYRVGDEILRPASVTVGKHEDG